VQFHPESIASEHGHQMLRNFLESAKCRSVSRHERRSAPLIGIAANAR
jgi:GMP synthase-like glutamine amidotransferase